MAIPMEAASASSSQHEFRSKTMPTEAVGNSKRCTGKTACDSETVLHVAVAIVADNGTAYPAVRPPAHSLNAKARRMSAFTISIEGYPSAPARIRYRALGLRALVEDCLYIRGITGQACGSILRLYRLKRHASPRQLRKR